MPRATRQHIGESTALHAVVFTVAMIAISLNNTAAWGWPNLQSCLDHGISVATSHSADQPGANTKRPPRRLRRRSTQLAADTGAKPPPPSFVSAAGRRSIRQPATDHGGNVYFGTLSWLSSKRFVEV